MQRTMHVKTDAKARHAPRKASIGPWEVSEMDSPGLLVKHHNRNKALLPQQFMHTARLRCSLNNTLQKHDVFKRLYYNKREKTKRSTTLEHQQTQTCGREHDRPLDTIVSARHEAQKQKQMISLQPRPQSLQREFQYARTIRPNKNYLTSRYPTNDILNYNLRMLVEGSFGIQSNSLEFRGFYLPSFSNRERPKSRALTPNPKPQNLLYKQLY